MNRRNIIKSLCVAPLLPVAIESKESKMNSVIEKYDCDFIRVQTHLCGTWDKNNEEFSNVPFTVEDNGILNMLNKLTKVNINLLSGLLADKYAEDNNLSYDDKISIQIELIKELNKMVNFK